MPAISPYDVQDLQHLVDDFGKFHDKYQHSTSDSSPIGQRLLPIVTAGVADAVFSAPDTPGVRAIKAKFLDIWLGDTS